MLPALKLKVSSSRQYREPADYIAPMNAEQQYCIPKPISTSAQILETIRCALELQRCRVLNTLIEIKSSHMVSHDQWTKLSNMSPGKPKTTALEINAMPIVTHHSKKYGLAAVITIPVINEL